MAGAPAGILWAEFKNELSEDFLDRYVVNEDRAYNTALLVIQNKLRSHGRMLEEVGLPSGLDDTTEIGTEMVRWADDDLRCFIEHWLPLLSNEKRIIYNYICKVVEDKGNDDTNLLFIDGPAGTGKTILLKVIAAALRKQNHIVLCTVSTGIAALNYKGGVTAHSMFRLPLETLNPQAYCDIKANSERAELLRTSSLIIWDEAPMAIKHNLETLERTLRDICQLEVLFGGKLVLLAGDFRQIAPVVKEGSVADSINSSIKFSYLWKQIKMFHLTNPIRSRGDEDYSRFILAVGKDKVNKICLENSEVIPMAHISTTDNLEDLINFVYPDNILTGPDICCRRAILAGTNSSIDEINLIVLEKLDGESVVLYSADTCEDRNENPHTELLNANLLHTISEPGISDHKIVVKKGAICILIRNLSFDDGLVNGTKQIVKSISKRLIETYIPGQDRSKTVFIPRICFKFQAGKTGITTLRRQFPIKLAYAMTINKSQGQTIDIVGLDLRNDVFAHGQLDVGLGCVGSRDAIRLLIPSHRMSNDNTGYAVNIVCNHCYRHQKD